MPPVQMRFFFSKQETRIEKNPKSREKQQTNTKRRFHNKMRHLSELIAIQIEQERRHKKYLCISGPDHSSYAALKKCESRN